MLVRIITGLIGIPIVVALVFFHGGALFALAIGLVAIVGVMEFYRGIKTGGSNAWGFIGIPAIIAILHASFRQNFTNAPIVYSGILTFLLVLALILELTRPERKPVANVGATALGVIYVGWLISHLIRLRTLPGWITVGSWHSEKGAWLLMLVFLPTWACDTGAYFAGRFFGKRKLAPSLSPGKTVEGSIGGFISSILIAAITGIAIHIPIGHAVVIGALIGVAAQLGDLVESSIKREIGIKDFGSILPGHGGALDRFDSLLFTGPLVYYYVTMLLPGWLS